MTWLLLAAVLMLLAVGSLLLSGWSGVFVLLCICILLLVVATAQKLLEKHWPWYSQFATSPWPEYCWGLCFFAFAVWNVKRGDWFGVVLFFLLGATETHLAMREAIRGPR